MSNATKNKPNCPFWSEHELKCQLCGNGLFIPLDDHIEVYCRTPEYTLCLQYNMSAESHPHQPKSTEQSVANRRHFKRFESNYRITLVQLTGSGQLASHYSLHASTVDLSMGGMRLRSPEPLLSDTRISFAFDDSFPEEIRSGTALIKWCHPKNGTNEYLAGLAFDSEKNGEAMGMYLRLHSPTQ